MTRLDSQRKDERMTTKTGTNRNERQDTMSKTDSLPHADWCKAGRIETTDHPEQGITTRHCVDCGAHEAVDRDGQALDAPTVTGGLVAGRRGAAWDVTMEPTGGAA